MKKVILFLFFTIQLLAQQYKETTTIKDFNHDGVNDTLVKICEYGTSYGGCNVMLTSGKTLQKFEMINEGGYGSRIRTVGVYEDLFLKENQMFLKEMKKELLPKKGKMESSLKWLISAGISAKRIDYDNKTVLFNALFYPKTLWESKLVIPKSYHIEVSKDTFKILEPEYETNNKFSKYFLDYYPSSREFKKAKLIVQNDIYQVFKTRHSIFVKHNNRYKWLFFSESGITGAPEKLRWESIQKIELVEHYLIVHQAVPPDTSYNIQIINIENQRVGRLNFEASYKTENGMDTFEIVDDNLVFTDWNGLIKIPLKKIFKTLDSY